MGGIRFYSDDDFEDETVLRRGKRIVNPSILPVLKVMYNFPYIRTALGSDADMNNSSAAWSAYDKQGAAAGEDSTSAVVNNDEWFTVVDVSASGHLSGVLGLESDDDAYHYIRITVDGRQYTLTAGPFPSTQRLLWGSFTPGAPLSEDLSTGHTWEFGPNCGADPGFGFGQGHTGQMQGNSSKGNYQPVSPFLAASMNMPVVYFNESLKVEVKVTAIDTDGGSYDADAAVFYTTAGSWS